MSATQEDILTLLERSLWVVDNARMPTSTQVHDHRSLPHPVTPAESALVSDVLESAIRPSNRGVRRVGLTVRLWLALLIMAAWEGQTTIVNMYKIATGKLPRELQWQLGILTKDSAAAKPRMMTEKQLYKLTENINRFLDTDPAFDLSEDEIAYRESLVDAITNALVHATQVLPHAGTSYAVDESGVWAWVKAKKKPQDLPMADPSDEDAIDPANVAAANGGQAPHDEVAVEHDGWSEQAEPDEDAPDHRPTAEQAATGPAEDTGKKRAPRVCWFARWGVKTHKTGSRSSYYGYALHALIRVPDVIKGDGKGARTNKHAEPRLVEQFALTSASTDVVDVTLDMVKTTIGRGHRVQDLLGDRHYSYKQFHRWAAQLWRLGVRPVLDLRQNDLGAADYDGSIILAGTPHCGVPEHLQRIERPGRGAALEQVKRYEEQILEREKFAMYRNKSPWGNGDGKTRWRCPARNGTVGCPRLAGSVDIAIANGLPIVRPPEGSLPWCTKDTVTIPAGPHMKHQQEEYWGSRDWLISWNRRTYVEGVFGNMKSHHTGNIRRGFMCLTGRALVSIAVAASIAAYNLRELEHWYARATEHEMNHPREPHNPLIDLYREHPLHRRTESIYGFTMLTPQAQAELDARHGPGHEDSPPTEDDLADAA